MQHLRLGDNLKEQQLAWAQARGSVSVQFQDLTSPFLALSTRLPLVIPNPGPICESLVIEGPTETEGDRDALWETKAHPACVVQLHGPQRESIQQYFLYSKTV